MIRTSFGLASLTVAALALPIGAHGQSPDLVHVPNVHGVTGSTRSVAEQTRTALDRLGEALAREGLDYGDVAVMNVFLRDARNFQEMNGVYRGYFQSDPPTRATVEADLLEPDAEIQISATAIRGPREVIVPSGLRSPQLPYSWGIRSGNTLFVAGATSRDPDTFQPVAGDVQTQTRRVFGNVGLVLESAGLGYEDLVSCKVFLNDARRFGEMNGAYAEFVPAEDPPARATVRADLVNVLFSTEIQCVAVDSGRRSVVRPEARGRSPYSPAIDVGDRVYVAGVVGRGATAAEEAQFALGSIGETLAAAGLGFDDLEDIWVYLGDIRDWTAVQDVLSDVLGPDAPEPTVVGTRTMGRAVVEIQVTAKR